MIHKLVAIAAWLLLTFIVYATLAPIQQRPTLPTSAGFEHVAAFAALGMLFSLAYPRQVVLVCLLVFGGAALLEFAQLLSPDRHGRLQDAIEKLAGGAAGVAVGQAILYFEQAGRWFQN
jgi:VanZ family protein